MKYLGVSLRQRGMIVKTANKTYIRSNVVAKPGSLVSQRRVSVPDSNDDETRRSKTRSMLRWPPSGRQGAVGAPSDASSAASPGTSEEHAQPFKGLPLQWYRTHLQGLPKRVRPGKSLNFPVLPPRDGEQDR